MTLRVLLTLLFAAMAAAAAAVMGVLSYAVTENRLQDQADDALAQAAQPFVEALQDGPNGGWGSGVRSLPQAVSTYLVQGLEPDGTVAPVNLPDASLPVDDTDLRLAGSTTVEQRFRTDSYQGVPIRMVTQSSGLGTSAVQVARDWSESGAVLRSLALSLTGIGSLVAALAAAGGWLLARRLTDRLLALTAAAEVVGTTGRLDADVPGGGINEVGRLAVAFNQMLARLAASRAEQQRLVQDAGHELRTPLTSLRTNVDLLARIGELDEADRRRVLDDLAGETRELTALVNEIIDLGADAPLNPEPSPVVLAEVALAVVDRARRRTGRDVEFRVDDSVVLGSRPALERALWNLIDNAVKFTDEGTITVTVAAGVVSVADLGDGIAEEDLPLVFERFHRSARARGMPGSGLGLSIVAEVARTHGGQAFASNREAAGGAGGGAVVGMRLPTIDEARSSQRAPDAQSPAGTRPD